MRILLVTPMPPRAEAPGAIPRVLHAQLVGLRERHELTLVTLAGDEAGEWEAVRNLERSGLDVHAVDTRLPRGLGRWQRRWRFAASWARGVYPWRTVWFGDPRVQNAIDRLASARSYDLAAVEDNAMGVFRFPPHLPVVLSEYEVRRPRPVDWRCGSPPNWPVWAFRELDWRRWSGYQLSVWERFDRLVVFTERDMRVVAEIAPELQTRVRVAPFGIDLPSRADVDLEEPATLLFTGNLTHPPNVDAAGWLAAEVMPRLRARRPDARLLLVGAQAPNEVSALQGPGVEVVGEVPVMGPYLERAAVVLAPVRTGGGMRMKVLHALAAGKAVVTTARGAEGFMLGGQPPLVIAEGADAIAAETARLLDEPERRRALGERARRYAADHYSAGAYGRRLEAVYDEAVACHSVAPAPVGT